MDVIKTLYIERDLCTFGPIGGGGDCPSSYLIALVTVGYGGEISRLPVSKSKAAQQWRRRMGLTLDLAPLTNFLPTSVICIPRNHSVFTDTSSIMPLPSV